MSLSTEKNISILSIPRQLQKSQHLSSRIHEIDSQALGHDNQDLSSTMCFAIKYPIDYGNYCNIYIYIFSNGMHCAQGWLKIFLRKISIMTI